MTPSLRQRDKRGLDFVDKIQSLTEASSSSATLMALVDSDFKSGSVRGGSYSNNLLLVKRGLDMVKVLFERLLVTRYVSILPCPLSFKIREKTIIQGVSYRSFKCQANYKTTYLGSLICWRLAPLQQT